MELLNIFSWFPLCFAGLLGLIAGSFLSVVTYRIPIMIQRTWLEQCNKPLANDFSTKPDTAASVFNLVTPRSHCPNCKTQIYIQHNIPIMSYIFLKGRCAQCDNSIPVRYPLTEATTATISVITVWVLGPTWEAVVALPLTWTLLSLSVIDIDKQLLPDRITLPLMWAGLLLSLISIDGRELITETESSLIGAAAGYLSLWSIYKLFKLLTDKEGMGYGDFKLLAALGAWLGWQYLPMILFISASVGAFVGLIGVLLLNRSKNTAIPFGPYLAGAGWITLLWGDELMYQYGLIFN
ncbi:MAG: A24 family peptidase [Gammaproteobacteria bacterium]|nr:A24 family peptidase [Gammaproteobacteria bacterium]